MSETREMDGFSQHFAASAKTTLCATRRLVNALFEEHPRAQRAAGTSALPRRRLAELRSMYLGPESRAARPPQVETYQAPLTAPAENHRWGAGAARTVVFCALVCAVALVSMRVLLTA